MRNVFLATAVSVCLLCSACTDRVATDTVADEISKASLASESKETALAGDDEVKEEEEIAVQRDRDVKKASGEKLEQQSYYMNFDSKATEDKYLLSGTVYQKKDKRGLVRIEAPEGTQISVKGKIKRISGAIKLIYEDLDGTATVVAEGSEDTEQEISVDTAVTVKNGKGNIYFENSPAVYDFELSLDNLKNIKYYLTGNNPVE